MHGQRSAHELVHYQRIESLAQEHVHGVFGNYIYSEQQSYKLVRKPNGKLKVVIQVPNQIESKRVWISNAMVLSAGVIGFGVLFALPEDYTNWNKEEIRFSTVIRNWRSNVSHGYIVDQDNLFLNYVMHPYFGAVYYMTLRGAGYPWWSSALYSFGMSTFFWEYGIEAFAEVPSIQDLIITPVGGSILGELFYLAKKEIKCKNDMVLGSGFLGGTCLLLIDPLNQIQDWFKKANIKKSIQKDYYATSSWQITSQGISLGVQVKF